MARVIVLGAGMVGSVMAREGEHDVLISDRRDASLEGVARGIVAAGVFVSLVNARRLLRVR